MASVPCGTCRLCCIRTLVVLVPPERPEDYEVEVVAGGYALKHKPNGECVYLDEKGCTIHERAPAICKEYDCRAQFSMYSRETRRDYLRRGLLDPAVLKRGRELILQAKKKGRVSGPESSS